MKNESDNTDEIELCYGMIDGVINHISQVDSGMLNHCLCPKCGSILIAKKGNIRKHHFAHYNHENCQGAQETALHLLAKELIYEEKCLYVPEKQNEPLMLLNFDHVTLEYRHLGLVFDAMGYVKNHAVGIEIKVTHGVDDNKRNVVINQNVEMIEIDLSNYLSGDKNRDEIKEAVIKTAPRYWVNRLSLHQEKQEETDMNKATITGFKLASGYSRKNSCDFVSNKLFVLQPVENKSTPNYQVAACGGYEIVLLDIADNSSLVDKLSGLTFPAEVQLTVEPVIQRNKLRPIVTDVNLIGIKSSS